MYADPEEYYDGGDAWGKAWSFIGGGIFTRGRHVTYVVLFFLITRRPHRNHVFRVPVSTADFA